MNNFFAVWASRFALGASIAFPIVVAVFVYTSHKTGGFMVYAKNMMPFFGMLYIMIQIWPLGVRGFHAKPELHDYGTSWFSLGFNILTLVISSLVMQLTDFTMYFLLYAIGYSVVDVALLRVSWLGAYFTRPAAGAAGGAAGGGGHHP